MDWAGPWTGIATRSPDPIITLVIYVAITGVGRVKA